MRDVFVVLVRTLATRGRVLALGTLGVVGIALGFAVHSATSRADVAYSLVDGYGLPVRTQEILEGSLVRS